MLVGWTPELRDAHFKRWIQTRSSDAGSAYASMGIGVTQRIASNSSDTTDPRGPRTPLSSSSDSSGIPVAFRAPSHSESELDDASQGNRDDTDDGHSVLVQISSPPRVWWRYRPKEEQLCPACRSEHMAQPTEHLHGATQHMPGAFPE